MSKRFDPAAYARRPTWTHFTKQGFEIKVNTGTVFGHGCKPRRRASVVVEILEQVALTDRSMKEVLTSQHKQV
jgi:hypothetical protein